MAEDKRVMSQYEYRIEMQYVDSKNNTYTTLINESVRSLIIDHNYDVNNMPILYGTLTIDKKMLDDMILNINTNLMIISIYKYDNTTDQKISMLVLRDLFTYFLPDDINTNDPIDYTDENINEHLGATFTTISMGFMSIKMINRNKRYLELNVKNNSIFDCAKYCLSGMENLIIEPFNYNEKLSQITMPMQESVNNALQFLNAYRVFYNTPYRFYQDFDFTYLVSSSGNAVQRDNEIYSSVLIEIVDISDLQVENIGVINNKTAQLYEVFVSYADTTVFDNTVANKSRTKLKGISSITTADEKSLINTAEYSQAKTAIVRLNNDNVNMINNIQADMNSNNFFVTFVKTDMDMSLFTINKRFTVHHIDQYQEFNGDYLLSRKRECLVREDDSFILSTIINMRKLERSTLSAITSKKAN